MKISKQSPNTTHYGLTAPGINKDGLTSNYDKTTTDITGYKADPQARIDGAAHAGHLGMDLPMALEQINELNEQLAQYEQECKDNEAWNAFVREYFPRIAILADDYLTEKHEQEPPYAVQET